MSRSSCRKVATCLLDPNSKLLRPTDSELLARFVNAHDEHAFAELVARHGGLVFGTARRWLRDLHAAEDVYQATFMILARKASGIRWMATIGPWLYATAVRLARKALDRTSSTSVAAPIEKPSMGVDPASAVAWGEICRILDEELTTLPERLREPLVLCYLQGYSRDEAAKACGCSLAMLKRHLERGRRLLSDRLMRRGITLPAAGIGMLASDLAVSATAVDTTAHSAVAFATRGVASPGIAGLLNGSRGSLKFKAVALVTALLGMIACGIAFTTFDLFSSALPDTSLQPPVTLPKADETASSDDPIDTLPPSAIARLGSARLRPGNLIAKMAFSPDGTKLASFSGSLINNVDNTFTIWETKTGRALRRFKMSGGIGPLVWLADGRGIALVLPGDSSPYLWEFTDEKAEKPKYAPQVQRRLTSGPFTVPFQMEDNERDSCYAISPDGTKLAIGRAGQLQKDREVQFWELKTGARLDTLKPLKGGVIHPDNCEAIHFTPDSKRLVVITQAKSLGGNKFESEQLVTVWDVATSREKSRFKAPRPTRNFGSAVALTNSTLAIGQEDGDTSLWDLTTGKESKLPTGHDARKRGKGNEPYYAFAFGPDEKTLATGGHGNVTKLWEVASGRLLHTLPHCDWVEIVAFAQSGKLLASAGQNGLIRLWDTTTGAEACPLPGHKSTVQDVAISSDGKFAVTSSADETLRLWDVEKGVELRSISVPVAWMGMNLSPDGKTVLVGTVEGKLRMWDTATGREMTPTNLPDNVRFENFTFTPDGKNLIVASGQRITIWEWPVLKLIRTLDLPKPSKTLPNVPENSEYQCQSTLVSPDGKWLVTVAHCKGQEGVVDVWELSTGKRVRRLVESLSAIRGEAFTTDGQLLVLGSGKIPRDDGKAAWEYTGIINLLEPVAGRYVRSFDIPPLPDTIAYRYPGMTVISPDGRTLYVSDSSGEILAYEVATGKLRRILLGHQQFVAGLAISSDGRRLISGSRDGLALVWDVTLPGAAISRKNPLTAEEAEKLWKVMSQDDAQAAFTALTELASSPVRALEIVQREIKPALAPTSADLDRIFTELGSEDFTTRERASKKLAEYGELVVPEVRKRLEGNPSAEVRQRGEMFLKQLDKAHPSTTRLRQIRAVELLEGLGTPTERKLLTELAAGAPSAALTRDAVAALKRLGK